jgi:hypothetical protein
MTDTPLEPPASHIEFYPTGSGDMTLAVRLQGDSAWLTVHGIAALYGTSRQNVSHHIKGIYGDKEISPEATCKKYLQVQSEGKRTVSRAHDYYNLEMIIAVGYRVKSTVATRFRQWATARLREYIVKGFTLDDERLKGADRLAGHFEELLARIREIRASEARVYQHIRDIFSLAVDYDTDEEATRLFFANMQNRTIYAATGHTAAEIVRGRADAGKANMGLTSYKGGRVRKGDVGIAKNYLSPKEIDTLNRITVMFLDQAQFRAERRTNIRMVDWDGFLAKFLGDNELPVLEGFGVVSHEDGARHAEEQYALFAAHRQEREDEVAAANYAADLEATVKQLESEAKAISQPRPRRKRSGKP